MGGKEHAQDIWPIDGGEHKAAEPISAERVRAIMNRYKIKKHA